MLPHQLHPVVGGDDASAVGGDAAHANKIVEQAALSPPLHATSTHTAAPPTRASHASVSRCDDTAAANLAAKASAVPIERSDFSSS